MIENSVSLDLLARLYSSQLITRGDKHLLDHNRTYYKLLRQIVLQGQQRGEPVSYTHLFSERRCFDTKHTVLQA